MIARGCAANNANVVLIDIDESTLLKAKAELEKAFPSSKVTM